MVLRRRYRVYFNPQGGSWYAAFQNGNGRERITLGVKTRPEAEAAVKQMDLPADERSATGPVLWSKVRDPYLQHKEAAGKADNTVKRYRASLDAFGRYLQSANINGADDISLAVLEGCIPYRIKTEGCDAKTAYTDALVIKNLFKWAAKPSRAVLKGNPALDWETKEPVKPKRKTYTREEVEKLGKDARPWLRPIITTLAWTGIRIGELINLRWADIDFEQRVINIRVQEEWKPKGRRDRTIPMHPQVEAVLKEQRVGQYVFSGAQGGRIKETYTLECLNRDQETLKLPYGDLHGFRRFFATTMMQAGVSAETVRQWGGWKSLETMLRYLADVDVKDSVTAMDSAAKKLAAS